MRTIRVLKKCPQTLFNYFFIRENRFNLFDFVPLANLRLHFKILWKRMTLQNFLQNKQRDVWLSIIAQFILQKVLLSHPFLMSQNFEMQGCQWYGVKRSKSIFADMENKEKTGKNTEYYQQINKNVHDHNITRIAQVSLRDRFRPCSRDSSGGITTRKPN